MADVSVQNLVKTYEDGKIKAVRDVTLSVSKGELFGLIGPDGAGKTSIFRILTTLLLPDSGSASVTGYDIIKDYKKIRKEVGYMPGKFSLYQDLSVEENLRFFATLFNTTIKENYELIRDIYEQIEPFKNRRAGKLSGGMKQKLALCCALIHKPTVLFLDEPTTGVDAVSRKDFWGMLKRLKEKGITILVSTPYMDEATLCERIALMQNGVVMSIDTPLNIISQYPEKLYAIKSENMGLLLKELRKSKLVKSCNAFGDYHHITLNGENSKDKLTHEMEKELGSEIHSKPIDPTIEDCFIHLMK